MKRKILLALGLALALTLCVSAALAAGVAKIGAVEYGTFDDAVAAAADGDTIVLLADAETKGLNLSKDLTVDGQNHTLTFNTYGIALWGKALTFRDMTVVMNGIGSTPYTAEWNWMTICASPNASLSLDAVRMTMDGDPNGTGVNMDKHGIYFHSNSKLSLTNGSVLTIKNYKQDALEWDGGDGGYNVNITDSTFVSDHNRSGFTGTFYATITNSKVDVINSLGNGSNGSHFIIKQNSKVNFNDNGSHGLSTGILTIDNSTVTASGNGANGIHATGELKISNGATVTVEDNDCSISSKWTIPGAFYMGGASSKIENSTVTIRNNRGSGIYQKSASGKLTIADSANVTVVCNTAEKLGYGGGIYVNGEANLGKKVTLYNNHAGTAGDDIYVNSGVITFGTTGKGWKLDGLPDCYGEIHAIDGWYEDGENAQGLRWNADAENEADRYIVKMASGTLQGKYALKAAHDVIPVPTNTPVPSPSPTPTPAPVAPPQTGDNSTPLAWLCALLACAACLTVLRFSRKRRA